MPVFNEYLRFLCQILVFTPEIIGYNVDTEFYILYQKGPEGNYFGYSVGLLENAHGHWALITAPRANSSSVRLQSLHQPGALFRCGIPTSGDVSQCEEIEVDSEGNVPHRANRFSSGALYVNKRDDMWLGVSLDVQNVSKDNNVVVCGHLWKNNVPRSGYYPSGACYVLNSDLNPSIVNKIVPFLDKGADNERTPLYYERAQAGTSAAFSEDGLSLLLGSPGYKSWKGTFVSYHLDPTMEYQQLDDPIIPDVQFVRPSAAYMGYSITSGKFFGDRTIYRAVGAPRDGNYRGRVYISLPLSKNRLTLDVVGTIEGKQTGEYFGASVSGIDLNGDSLTDLLVGAPFHSHESGGDEGKVYVYLGTKQKTSFQSYDLYGENKPNARFGTCIGNIGDLNQDGFNDVAIGAPYEDEKGAVYIYHGGNKGNPNTYAQRISAEKISPQISGFGISISRGLDIDGNSYPDILIGAYANSSAVLLRTYPVIYLMSSLTFDIPKIDMNISACGGKLPCVNVTYCLTYSGRHVPFSLEFQTELRIDVGRRRDPAASRGFFLPDGQTKPQTSISRRIQVHAEPNGNCFIETAYIYKNISDVITPILFLLSCDLDRNATVSCQSNGFPKDCPVIDSTSPTTLTERIGFKIDCKDTCQANLNIEAVVAGNPEKRTLIIGQNDSLTLDVIVRNVGEPAYVTEVFISLPPETPLVKYDPCEMGRNQREEYVNTTLTCKFRNPLKNGETANIQIIIDLKNIPAGTSSLPVYFRATTVSDDIDKSNNELTLSINFEAAANVNITGNPENPRIPQAEENRTVSVTHNYYVKYYGPSPVDKIDINLYVPSSINGENGTVTFLTLNGFVSDSGEILTKCNVNFTNMGSKSYDEDEQPESGSETLDANLSANNSHHITKRSAEKSAADSTTKERKDYILNCETAICDVIRCNASPFRSGQKSIKLVLTFQINLGVLSTVMKAWKSIQFITKGEISMGGVKMLSNIYRNETTVETEMFRLVPPIAPEVENWIIFASIGVGLLVLLIILIILIKIGFFKRKQRERMKSMRQQVQAKEMQTMTGANEQEAADDRELCRGDES